MSQTLFIIIVLVLLVSLIVVGGFFLFELRLRRLYHRAAWIRFERRTGIKRPKYWDQPLIPVTELPRS